MKRSAQQNQLLFSKEWMEKSGRMKETHLFFNPSFFLTFSWHSLLFLFSFSYIGSILHALFFISTLLAIHCGTWGVFPSPSSKTFSTILRFRYFEKEEGGFGHDRRTVESVSVSCFDLWLEMRCEAGRKKKVWQEVWNERCASKLQSFSVSFLPSSSILVFFDHRHRRFWQELIEIDVCQIYQ